MKTRIWLWPRHGSLGIIAFGWWVCIKAPWNEPLYAERYGGLRWPTFMGWRFCTRKFGGDA